MSFKELFRKKDIQQAIRDCDERGEVALMRTLGLRDLVSFGIAAIIGAGIFSTIGNACADGGPAVSLLFVFTAIACLFSALCYAQFASSVPVAGSAYTYAYVSLGELFAWIIGWDLLMEYAIGNIAVAISWSDYFTSFFSGIGLHIPEYLTMDYLTASASFEKYNELAAQGADIPGYVKEGYIAFNTAPQLGSLKLIADFPALLVVIFITYLVYIGIKESRTTGNILVFLKLAVIFLIIIVGMFYVKPENWFPFAPNGTAGVLSGVSAVFFAYIGFDAISTTAEECKDSKKDLPRAMFMALAICTVLYVLLVFILTGLVNYKELAVGDPLAYAFDLIGLNFFSGIIAVSAIVAMTSVLLVFQLGQPRIWMSMSRDGLLPKAFSRIHPKFQTPGFSTIVTGIVVGVPALFVNLGQMVDLTAIGTLFAFVLVCAGILMMDHKQIKGDGFRVPYINGKYIVPILFIVTLLTIYLNLPEETLSFLRYESWEVFQHKIPLIGFLIVCLIMSVLSFIKNLSLIPTIGLLINLYLMSELGVTNWVRFLIWLVIGLAIYFMYSKNRSKLKQHTTI